MCSDFSSVLSRVRNPNSSEDPSSNCATFPSLSTIITTTTTTTNVVGAAAAAAAAAGLDEDDWPTTPTSSDQKIPEIGLCPPAPRRPKSKPIVRKRKRSSSSSSSSEFGGGIVVHNTNYCCNNNNNSSASRLLDFSKEIELMYPPHLKANLGRKIKKARSL